MVDFFVLNISNLPEQYLLTHPDLEWMGNLNFSTGELECYNKNTPRRSKPLQYAMYKNLKIELYNNEIKKIRGSLQRYANNGLHNGIDLDLAKINSTIDAITKGNSFNIPEDSELMTLESGVTIDLGYPVADLLARCLFQHSQNLKFKEFSRIPYPKTPSRKAGICIKIERSELVLKLYDKGSELNMTNPNLLRIELKYFKSRPLRRNGIRTLGDLRKVETYEFLLKELIKHFDAIFLFDKGLYNNKSVPVDLVNKFQIPRYWSNDLSQLNDKLKKYKSILRYNDLREQEIVKQKIVNKIKSLICPN